ncbi:MAG TPA: hypothetical protein VLS93_08605 [Anaeromyxobacteraceae bacterium]|nr:hypothetical protein [Anaeromyxobacteraceae bacterium]
MRVPWAGFAVGLWLVFAPLLLGYGEAFPVLHDVALGLLVCTASLAGLERPPLRFALALPAAWLLWAGRNATDPAASANEIASGAALVLLGAVPIAWRAARALRPGRARA